jgi:hypothetical protein
MRECDNLCLLIMLDTLLLGPSPHCNTSLHFTTLHQTTLHYTYRHFTSSHLHFTTLPFGLTHLHIKHYITEPRVYCAIRNLQVCNNPSRLLELNFFQVCPIWSIERSSVFYGGSCRQIPKSETSSCRPPASATTFHRSAS